MLWVENISLYLIFSQIFQKMLSKGNLMSHMLPLEAIEKLPHGLRSLLVVVNYFTFDIMYLLVAYAQASDPFFLLAGPNVIESEEHVLKMAKHIKSITSK